MSLLAGLRGLAIVYSLNSLADATEEERIKEQGMGKTRNITLVHFSPQEARKKSF